MPNSPLADIIVVYPGRFQPFHFGHAHVFKELLNRFNLPKHTFVALSSACTYPFNVESRKFIARELGIPRGNTITCKTPYRFSADDFKPGAFDPETTRLIVAVGGKDMEGNLPRFNYNNTKHGPAYYQPFTSIESMVPASQHGYITIVPTETITIDGCPDAFCSASQIRKHYTTLTHEKRHAFIQQLYPQSRHHVDLRKMFDTSLFL